MGYGDDIMITGYAKVLKQKHPNYQIVAGNKKRGFVVDSVIFNNNPNISRVSELKNMQTIWIDSYSGHRPYFIKETSERYYWNENHKVAIGELYFSIEEKDFAKSIISNARKWWNDNNNKSYKKIIFIEPSRIKTLKSNAFENRSWGLKKWQSFVNIYKDRYLFVQSVFKGSETLDGVYKFESGFREACSVLEICDFIIGWEGGFSHAAASVNKKGLFLYGGWINPKFIGYTTHRNIYVDIEGSPCGMKTVCKHCNKCNDIMSVEMVSKEFSIMVEK